MSDLMKTTKKPILQAAKKNSAIQKKKATFPKPANDILTLQRSVGNQAVQQLFKSEVLQKKDNKTGLPDKLKSGIESLSGHSMDDVKVHYNSSKSAQLNAFAFAKGSDIHLASGAEKYLPHEAWHVVQQKQGRVQPTLQMKGKVNINDDIELEREADVMGVRALQMKTLSKSIVQREISTPINKYVKRVPKSQSARFKIGNIQIIIKQDIRKRVLSSDGRTNINISSSGIIYYSRNNKITKFKKDRIKIIIQTVYRVGVNKNIVSAYGRGTTTEDKEAGNTSLKFHEGSHGTDYLQYIKQNPYPIFKGKINMEKEVFIEKIEKYRNEKNEYLEKINKYTENNTDCVGKKANFCN